MNLEKMMPKEKEKLQKKQEDYKKNQEEECIMEMTELKLKITFL